jgi:hypothetical protein
MLAGNFVENGENALRLALCEQKKGRGFLRTKELPGVFYQRPSEQDGGLCFQRQKPAFLDPSRQIPLDNLREKSRSERPRLRAGKWTEKIRLFLREQANLREEEK